MAPQPPDRHTLAPCTLLEVSPKLILNQHQSLSSCTQISSPWTWTVGHFLSPQCKTILCLFFWTMIQCLGFMATLFFLCLVGCFSKIILTPAVLSVLYACFSYFCICTYSAQLSMFHMERRSRNALIIILLLLLIAWGITHSIITLSVTHKTSHLYPEQIQKDHKDPIKVIWW